MSPRAPNTPTPLSVGRLLLHMHFGLDWVQVSSVDSNCLTHEILSRKVLWNLFLTRSWQRAQKATKR